MLHLRVLMAWLLLAALPVQALAAATMLYCGPAAKAQAQHAQGAAAHDHEAHGHQPAGKHDRAAHGQAQSSADADPQADTGNLPDSSHKCGVCASCGNGVGIVTTTPALDIGSAPQTHWEETFVQVHSRPSSVPDKPPRA